MTLSAGADLGGTKIQAIVRRDGELAGRARVSTPQDGGPDDVAKTVAQAVREACDDAGVEPKELDALGIGAPGPSDPAEGVLLYAPNVPGFDQPFPLAPVVGERLGVRKVVLTNDVRAGIVGEHRLGAGRPFRNLLGVFAGTGVGGGLVLNGRPWTGRGAAGEFGHLCVVIDGAPCGCGRFGCVEAYAGRASMEARARQLQALGQSTVLFEIQARKKRPSLTSGVWASALEREDAMARTLLARAVEALGAGIASVHNLLDLEAVVIGGGLGDRLGAPFVDDVTRAMQPHLLVPDRPPAVVPSGLGDLGGALGAALLAEDG
jgi:glucokinase